MNSPQLSGPTEQWPETWPPVRYIKEKLGESLVGLHLLWRDIHQYVPDDLVAIPKVPLYVKDDVLLSHVRPAFIYGYTALLSLLDRQNQPNQPTINDLLALSHEDFQAWLDAL